MRRRKRRKRLRRRSGEFGPRFISYLSDAHYPLDTGCGACEGKTDEGVYAAITKIIAHAINSNYKCEQELLPGECGVRFLSISPGLTGISCLKRVSLQETTVRILKL